MQISEQAQWDVHSNEVKWQQGYADGKRIVERELWGKWMEKKREWDRDRTPFFDTLNRFCWCTSFDYAFQEAIQILGENLDTLPPLPLFFWRIKQIIHALTCTIPWSEQSKWPQPTARSFTVKQRQMGAINSVRDPTRLASTCINQYYAVSKSLQHNSAWVKHIQIRLMLPKYLFIVLSLCFRTESLH